MNWISVEDRFPEEGEYLVSDGKNVTSAAFFYGIYWTASNYVSEEFDMNQVILNIKPTHWMPLPNPSEL